ncbi:MAG TPA: YtxH domain-containing protein [Sphingobacteriaceae bacterium]
MKISSLLLTGIAAGAAAWYLMYTESGRRVTDNIGSNLGPLKQKANDTIDQIKGQMGGRGSDTGSAY